MSRQQEIEASIAVITAELKGWMPDLERALLVADRRDLRAELTTLREENGLAKASLK